MHYCNNIYPLWYASLLQNNDLLFDAVLHENAENVSKATIRDVNKDLIPKDQDKDLTPKDQDKDLKKVLKESLRTRTRTRINIPGYNYKSIQTQTMFTVLKLIMTEVTIKY